MVTIACKDFRHVYSCIIFLYILYEGPSRGGRVNCKSVYAYTKADRYYTLANDFIVVAACR